MMGMYSLIEDARMKAKDAADNWHTTPEAQALLAKIDAFERESDRWYGESREIARAFKEARDEAESDLDTLRSNALDAAARTYGDKFSGEWFDAYDIADEDAPTVAEVIEEARRDHAGDEYLRIAA
jgi:hypothetical protein